MLYDSHGRKLRRVCAVGFTPAPDRWIVAEPENADITPVDAVADIELAIEDDDDE